MKPVLIILIIFFAVRYLRKYLSARTHASPGAHTPVENAGPAKRPSASHSGEDMVLDPVCNSYIPVSSALSTDGVHFCGPECRDKFMASKGA